MKEDNEKICNKCRIKLIISKFFSLFSILFPIIVIIHSEVIGISILSLYLIIIGIFSGIFSQIMLNVGISVGLGRIGIIFNIIVFYLVVLIPGMAGTI